MKNSTNNDCLLLDSSASNLVPSSAIFERCNLSNDRFYESVKDQQKLVANASLFIIQLQLYLTTGVYEKGS